MPRLGAVVGGFKDVANALKGIETRALTRRVLRDTLLISAKPVVKRARDLVARRTGELRKGIKARVVPRLKDTVAIKIGPAADQFYGHFLEFGTVRVAAKPFLRPAWIATKAGIRRNIILAMWGAVFRMAKRLAKKGKLPRKLSRRFGL